MSDFKLCTGLDIGTNTIIAARMDNEGVPVYRVQRDAFFEIKPVTPINAMAVERSLKAENRLYIKNGNSFFIVGDDAVDIAIKRGSNTRRPLSKGVLSSTEKESLPMVKFIINSIIGKARVDNEPCYYSIPAEPVEGEFDIVFHNGIIKSFLTSLGYKPVPILEAEAVIFSELLDTGLSGMALSFGAGMVNVCLMSEGETLVSFSIPKSGDWIDHSVANIDVDLTDSLVQQTKESGIDLMSPKSKLEQAIAIYYDYLLAYVVKSINFVLNRGNKSRLVRQPITIVLAGGATLVGGFIDKFSKAVDNEGFAIPISEIKYAEDRLNAVAKGCLLAALLDTDR